MFLLREEFDAFHIQRKYVFRIENIDGNLFDAVGNVRACDALIMERTYEIW